MHPDLLPWQIKHQCHVEMVKGTVTSMFVNLFFSAMELSTWTHRDGERNNHFDVC